MRAELLTALLHELHASVADIEASAVLSIDGLVIASVLPAGVEEDRLGAMTAAMMSLAERTARELQRGELEQVLVKGSGGWVLMTRVSPEVVLTVQCVPAMRLGLVQLDIRRTVEQLERVL